MPIPDQALWREMLRYLRRHHGPVCRQWFEELEPLTLNGGVLTVRANNPVQQRYLAHRCVDLFNEAAQSITEALVTVSFVNGTPAEPARDASPSRPAIDPGDASGGPEPAAGAGVAVARAPVAVSARPLGEDDQVVLSPDYSFDNFVTGPGNRLAFAAAKAVADNPGGAYNPLFIHGGVGLGKTHLLQAICQALIDADPRINICYLSCDTFMNLFLESVQNGQMSGFRNRYRHVDLLLIDDIHFLAKRDRTQEEFFHTFNTLYQAGRQIVLSSDSPPEEIPELEERLVSRFKCGLVTRVEKPCYDTRVAIIKKKAAIRGLHIPDDAVCHIATTLDSNIRELEGAINHVQYLSDQSGLAIDLDLVRQALGEAEMPTPPQVTIQHIIDAVIGYYDVKLSDLQSKRRPRSITGPRQVCMYLARKRTRYSLEEIGGYFGGRDHTTVMHAIRTTEVRIGSDPIFAAEVDQIDRHIGGEGVAVPA